MRIESVTAHAFGPFVDETLHLAPGMTVVYGPNESGKSSWHAALYVALCGMRRSGTGVRDENNDFKARHRPWNGSLWKVSVVVQLENGRKVDIRRDLDLKTGEAHDADLGRDYSSDIINDGAPDGAIWLGLDRRSFLSTACVRQADIQSVVNDAKDLRTHMQRAAATAGADETAAAALKAIEDFRRNNVGQDRRNATKPLRDAKDRLEAAQGSLQVAQKAHAEYVAQLEEIETLENNLAQAERDLQIVEAARARAAATEAQRGLDRARELGTRYPHDPGLEHEQQGNMAQESKQALYSWKNRPAAVGLTGPGTEELQSQLDSLPPMPEGDSAPHPTVVSTKDDYNLARRSLESHSDGKPAAPDDVDTGGLNLEDLRDVIKDLSLEEPSVDPRLQERVNRAQAKVDGFAERNTRKPSGPFAWLLRLIAAILTIFQGKRGDDTNARLRAENELAVADRELGTLQYKIKDVHDRKGVAKGKAAAHGLPDDPEALRVLAERLDKAIQAERDLKTWRGQETILQKQANEAEQALAEALRARGTTSSQPVADTLAAYETACNERDKRNREAARRPDLEEALKARKREESAADADERRRAEASGALRRATEALRIREEDEETLAARLRDWVKAYEDAALVRKRAAGEWNELRHLLGEGSTEGLESAAEKTRKAAETAAQGSDERAINAAVLEPDTGAQVRKLRRLESECKANLSGERGGLEEVARNLPKVAEAEEEVERAEAECERVTNLGNILSKTQEFLKQAQDEVHRDIAPHLVNALTPWVKDVTGGRYSSVVVDPQDLMVRVSGHGGSLRDAPLLSHGTTEQIYLLLRVAMASLLTRASGETCPLLLDDVTVHCDSTRQNAILDLLHKISRERQIILFSQEPETLTWAQQRLQGTADRLVELDPSGIPA